MIRILVTGLIISFLSNLPATAGDRMTPERLWDLGRLGSAAVNAQGNLVAYAVRNYNLQENSGRSEIHLYDLKSKRDWVVVRDLKSAGSLQFVELRWRASVLRWLTR